MENTNRCHEVAGSVLDSRRRIVSWALSVCIRSLSESSNGQATISSPSLMVKRRSNSFQLPPQRTSICKFRGVERRNHEFMMMIMIMIVSSFHRSSNPSRLGTHTGVTVTILDIIHRPVFHLKHIVGKVRTSLETHYVSATDPNRLMRSIGLWRWYINITVTILDIICGPVFYLKHIVGNVRTSLETHYVSATDPNRLMRSIGLWRWYINVTIPVLDIICGPVFYLKHIVGNVRTSQETHYVSATSPTG
jgi:hypothetical protein